MKDLISSVSTVLSIAIVAFTLVLAIPLFPNNRSSEESSKTSGCVFYVVSSIFLLCEIRVHTILYYIWINLCIKWNWFLHKMHVTNSLHLYQEFCNDFRIRVEHNLLAYFFFLGYLSCQVWNIGNDFYYIAAVPSCFDGFDLVSNILKLILASLLLLALIFSDVTVRDRQASSLQNIISKIGWGIVVAVCFRSAFRYVVEEVEYGYIDIVEKSIEYPDYGLNFTKNCTKVEDCVAQIFKLKAKCFEHVILPKYAEYILELIPFSTEYFSLATVFCFLKWKQCGQSSTVTNNDHDMQGPQDESSTEDDIPNSGSSSFAEFRSLLVGKFPRSVSLATIFLILTPTLISICYFYTSMKFHKYDIGVYTFIVQQFILQTLILTLELCFYIMVIRKIEPSRVLPKHFQLDSLLLILPLFPLGILFTLRVYPDLVMLDSTNDIHYTHSETLWTLLNIFLAVYNFVQVSFQAIFIQSVLVRYNHQGLHRTGPYFLILAILNFCIWLSWTLECKLITIHGRSFQIFGVVEWIIIVYSTVPFVMFCFAHTTACFVEIRAHIINGKINHAPASINNDNLSIFPPLNIEESSYGSTRQTNGLEVTEFENSIQSDSV